MKRAFIIIAAVAALAAGCAKNTAPHGRVGVAIQPPPGRVIGFDPSVVGLPGAIDDTVYDAAGIISWKKYGTSNTAWRPIPVSQFVTGDPSVAPGLKAPIGFVVTAIDGAASWIKSTTSDTGWVVFPTSGGGAPDGGAAVIVADGGLLSGNGTSASPLSAVQQFGSDTILRQLNDISSNVNTLELHNFYTSNTHGAETAVLDMTAPLSGTQVTQRLTSLNGAGAQFVTSSGSTFSVTWNPQSDLIVITYTQDTTQTTISGANLDQDFEYEIDFTPSIGATSPTIINVDLNGSTSTYTGIVQFTHATSAGSGMTRFACMDVTLAASVAMAQCFVRKIPGKAATWNGVNFNVEGGGNFIETIAGTSNITANVTSLVFNGTIGNGTVATVRKTRPTTR